MGSEKWTVIIVGNGKLANELLHGLASPVIGEILHWPAGEVTGVLPAIVVHAGSGRELPTVIDYCARTSGILLDLSTTDPTLPAALTFPIVRCPNVNAEMLAFMAMVKQAAALFREHEITLTESHQASKTSPPGTAIYLARSLGLSEAAIRSVRDPVMQATQLAIPAANLDRHAYHEIAIRSPEVEIRLETRVLGKAAYARGLASVIDVVATMELAPGVHDVVDLIAGHANNPPVRGGD